MKESNGKEKLIKENVRIILPEIKRGMRYFISGMKLRRPLIGFKLPIDEVDQK
jgi:hypothetical protein